MEDSWKKFFSERKGQYKSKFPFLKEDQIAAKLKRIWCKGRASPSGGLGNQHRTRFTSCSVKKKPTNGDRAGFCCCPARRELRQKNASLCWASPHPASLQTLQEESLVKRKQNTVCTKHWREHNSASTSPSKHTALPSKHQNSASACDTSDGTGASPQQSSSDCNTLERDSWFCTSPDGSLQENNDKENFLCAMFAPLPATQPLTAHNCDSSAVCADSHSYAPPSHLPAMASSVSSHHSTPPSSMGCGRKYCLFLNEGDIFM